MTHKVIVTSDPGQDQAVALLEMLGRPDVFEILGIVATAGNVGLDHTLRNTRQLLELTERTDVPVYRGSVAPMARKLVTAEHVHGPTGMDGFALPEPTVRPVEGSGVDFIVETLRHEAAESVTIISLSPLTNLGMALRKAPDVAERIKEIVMMAGAYFEVGNITPTAEFNVYVDPEAADIVFRSGVPMTVIPLDVTHKMLATAARLERFRELGNRAGKAVAGWLAFSEKFDVAKYQWGAAPLHGPCVPAYVLEPRLFAGRDVNITVELSGQLTTGMTVVDYWQITDRPHNAHYVSSGDPDRYFATLVDCVAKLP